jgi:hypothetical protein
VAQLPELLKDPAWFPAAIDTKAGTLGFARIDRDSLSKEAFLDQRMAGSVTAQETARLAEVIAGFSGQQQTAPAFIFHTAFCCSTLLARALDAPGTALALKEPDVLMGLANVLRVDEELRRSRDRAEALVQSIFGLLARRFAGDERILIKPTNAANNLLPDAVRCGAPVVLLYGDLRSFLVSVLKKGEACKSFVRQQYNIFALDADGLAAIPQRQAVAFTDLQAATAVWRHQMELFQRTLGASRRDQVVSLNFKTLLEKPVPVLQAVARHLDLPHSDAALESIVNGPIFTRNAKFAGQAYDAGRRDRDAQTIEERYGETLDLIETWGGQLDLGTDLRMPLPGAIDL